MMRKLLGTIVAAVAFGLVAAVPAVQAQEVTVGSTHQTEDSILGSMAAILLKQGLNIDIRHVDDLRGTGIAHSSIINGEIDIYPDYTGDALSNVLDMEPIPNSRKAFDVVKKNYKEEYDIVWLEPTPFNNTYALAMEAEDAEKHGITKISDLEPYAQDWTLGSSIEFAGRELDGYPGMVKHYGFEFGNLKPMDVGLMYSAVDSDRVNVIVAFATDARIDKLDLRVLQDDKKFFPAYNAAYTVRQSVLDAHPEVADALIELTRTLDTKTMSALNGRVDIQNQSPDKVARNYLNEQGMI